MSTERPGEQSLGLDLLIKGGPIRWRIVLPALVLAALILSVPVGRSIHVGESGLISVARWLVGPALLAIIVGWFALYYINSSIRIQDGVVTTTNWLGRRSKRFPVDAIARVAIHDVMLSGTSVRMAFVLGSSGHLLARWNAVGWTGDQLEKLWAMAGVSPEMGGPIKASDARRTYGGVSWVLAHPHLVAVGIFVVLFFGAILFIAVSRPQG
jgi:hypothetical protein